MHRLARGGFSGELGARRAEATIHNGDFRRIGRKEAATQGKKKRRAQKSNGPNLSDPHFSLASVTKNIRRSRGSCNSSPRNCSRVSRLTLRHHASVARIIGVVKGRKGTGRCA